jgi:hypothetical protein
VTCLDKTPDKKPGRPAGDVRQALLQAVQALATTNTAPTLRELAARACVGHGAARQTVCNMVRAGLLVPVRQRRVPYRNRPVLEYAQPGHLPVLPPAPSGPQGHDFAALTQLVQRWGVGV